VSAAVSAYSRGLVIDSVQTTRLSRDLYAQIALLERSARLYQVLGDASKESKVDVDRRIDP